MQKLKLIAFVGYENSFKYKYCQFLTALGYQNLDFYKITSNVLEKLLFYKKQNKSICTCNLTTLHEFEILNDFCKENNIELKLYYCSTYNCDTLRPQGHDLIWHVESCYNPDLTDLQEIDITVLEFHLIGKQWASKE